MSGFEVKSAMSDRSKNHDSISDEVEEKDLYALIQEKDKKIMKLQNKIQRLQKEKQEYLKGSQMKKPDFNEMLYFKEKIGQQLNTNDKAVFLQASHRISKLIGLLQTKSQLSTDSADLKGIIQNIGGTSISQSFLSEEELDSPDEDQSEEKNGEKEMNKMMDQLQLIANEFRKSFQTLKRENDCLERMIKQVKKQNDDTNEVQEKNFVLCRKERQHFKKLLEKTQVQKNNLINSIMGVLSPENQRQLQKMDKRQLLNFIRQVIFKLQQVETEKKEIQKTYSKNKEIDLQKYKKILEEVKRVKEAQEAWNDLSL